MLSDPLTSWELLTKSEEVSGQEQQTDTRDSVLAVTPRGLLPCRISLLTSHDHSRVFNLRPDEVHSDHSGQVVHAHLVDRTVQLDFMQKSMGNSKPHLRQWEGPRRERESTGPTSFPCFWNGVNWLCLQDFLEVHRPRRDEEPWIVQLPGGGGSRLEVGNLTARVFGGKR